MRNRMMDGLKTLIACLFMLALAAPGFSAPLWSTGRDLYSSQGGKEFHPGDIITIVVSEEATAQQSATTNTQDDSSLEVKTGPAIPFFNKVVNQFTGKNEVKNSWKGNGTTSRSGKLAGTVTAKVLEIMPNGNLLLEGTRSMRVNKDTQLMRVRGVARAQDVDAKNQIDSKKLADAEIKFEGKGGSSSTQRPGLMTKIGNILF